IGSAPAATLSAGQIRSLMGSWGGQIRARVERHKTPPAGAGAGRVVVALNVARDGRLLGAAVAKSSGNAALDQAALDAVRRAGRFPVAPQGLAKARYSFTLPMTFR
ncbi:MAG: TonB family protein, partial [Thioclava sp.]